MDLARASQPRTRALGLEAHVVARPHTHPGLGPWRQISHLLPNLGHNEVAAPQRSNLTRNRHDLMLRRSALSPRLAAKRTLWLQ